MTTSGSPEGQAVEMGNTEVKILNRRRGQRNNSLTRPDIRQLQTDEGRTRATVSQGA